MQYLEEHDIGFDTGVAKVPLVVQSDIYDLTVGSATVRPDSKMGYAAAKAAFETPNYKDGNFGAGCGASVGKIGGMDTAMKTGVGSYAIQIGELQIGAIVVLNALGDIYDWKSGAQVAGLLNEDRTQLQSTLAKMSGSIEAVENKFTGNTTIAAVITNGRFDKAQLCKIAGVAHNGYARAINPGRRQYLCGIGGRSKRGSGSCSSTRRRGVKRSNPESRHFSRQRIWSSQRIRAGVCG